MKATPQQKITKGIANLSKAIVQFVSKKWLKLKNLSSGAKPHVEITCTKNVKTNGPPQQDDLPMFAAFTGTSSSSSSSNPLPFLCLISQQRTNPIYPLSRAVWENDTPNLSPESLRSLRDDVDNLNTEGYVNLASQFGLSGKRGMGPLYLRPLFLQRLPLDTTTDYTIPVDLSVYSPFSTARPSSYWRFGNRRVRE